MNDIMLKAIGTAPAQGISPVRPAPVTRPEGPRAGGLDFADLVAGRLNAQRDVKFSAHAKARMESRSLNLSPAQAEELRGAVDLAAAKGARQSLVLMNNLALIVNVPSRTVITALGNDGAQGNVFTNIDSAVIAQGGDAGTD